MNIKVGDILDFTYTGTVQVVTLPKGKYTLECWGAQGGYRDSSSYGGKGGKSYGILTLVKPTLLYIYVGGSGFVWTGSNAPTGYLLGTEYYLANAVTKAGNVSFGAVSTGKETGHGGNGHVRITVNEVQSLNLPAKISEAWKNSSDAFIKINGSWKNIDSVYAKINGIWKLSS